MTTKDKEKMIDDAHKQHRDSNIKAFGLDGLEDQNIHIEFHPYVTRGPRPEESYFCIFTSGGSNISLSLRSDGSGLIASSYKRKYLYIIVLSGVTTTVAKDDIWFVNRALGSEGNGVSLLGHFLSKFNSQMLAPGLGTLIKARGVEFLVDAVARLDGNKNHPFSLLGLFLQMENETGMTYYGQRLDPPGQKATDTGVYQIIASTYRSLSNYAMDRSRVLKKDYPSWFKKTLKHTFVVHRSQKKRGKFETDPGSAAPLDSRDIYFQSLVWYSELDAAANIMAKKDSDEMAAFALSSPIIGWGIGYASTDFSSVNGKTSPYKTPFRDAVSERMFGSIYAGVISGRSFSYNRGKQIAADLDASASATQILNKGNVYNKTMSVGLLFARGLDESGSLASDERGYVKLGFSASPAGWSYRLTPFRLFCLALCSSSWLNRIGFERTLLEKMKEETDDFVTGTLTSLLNRVGGPNIYLNIPENLSIPNPLPPTVTVDGGGDF